MVLAESVRRGLRMSPHETEPYPFLKIYARKRKQDDLGQHNLRTYRVNPPRREPIVHWLRGHTDYVNQRGTASDRASEG